jgi:serine/threonine protein kinase
MMRTDSIGAGMLIADRYRLEEPLVRGAMGMIWRAEHVGLKAPVAVKFLDPVLLGDQEMRGRFLQEARSAAAVRSAHVVQVFDSGIEQGVPYIVMELLEGESLEQRLNERGVLSPSELRKIFGEVARALGKAHSLGVVHRDLKPANIFLAREGPYEITKLVDFGIAKVRSEALGFTQAGTRVGTLLGTPQYMSPEQARGSGSVDYRTDLWALAIVACECLTGRCPFSGKTVGDLTVQICTERPTPPSQLGNVPPGFDAWFFKATGKAPGQRFKSIAAMEGALTPILSSAEARAMLPAGLPRAWAAPSWSLLRRSQIRSVSRSLATGIELRVRQAREFLREVGSKLEALLQREAVYFREEVASLRSRFERLFALLPEPRRRIAVVALLSLCGMGLLAVSRTGRTSSAISVDPPAAPTLERVRPASVSDRVRPTAVPPREPAPALEQSPPP